MVFSSPLFLFLFVPIFFLAYFLTVRKYRNLLALIGSIVFYAWGGPTFLFTLLVSLLLDWHLVNAIYNSKEKYLKKFYFLLALVMNIGLLVYYKYSNFFVLNLNELFKYLHLDPIKWTEVLLPIGISFIVFHKISYIIDIFRNEKKPTDKISDYYLYILLFPMSIAGPIIKYQDISEQLHTRESRFEDILSGTFRFSIGLLKKVWIADNVAIVADQVFASPSNLSIGYAWIGIICYSLQIYFDFSGYADMAIGLSRIMGFKVAENFNKPYISQNITEFWRRWHISLSSWMRNYIYFPLGGNRCSKIRNYFNLWVVFFISGLWHGANWTFVIWGILHGVLIVSDKLFWLKLSRKLPKFFNITLTFLLILITWVFFRADTIHQALSYLKAMFNFSNGFNLNPIRDLYFTNSLILIIVVSIIIIFLPASKIYNKILLKYNHIFSSNLYMIIVTIGCLFFAIVKCVTSTFSPFIYFRF